MVIFNVNTYYMLGTLFIHYILTSYNLNHHSLFCDTPLPHNILLSLDRWCFRYHIPVLGQELLKIRIY